MRAIPLFLDTRAMPNRLRTGLNILPTRAGNFNHLFGPGPAHVAAEHLPFTFSLADAHGISSAKVLLARLVGRPFSADEEDFEVPIAVEVGDDRAGVDHFVDVSLHRGVERPDFLPGLAVENAKLPIAGTEQ